MTESNKKIWQQVIGAMNQPSMKMLLAQQAALKNIDSQGFLFWKTYQAEIEISEKWINMIQSRKNLIEAAFSEVLDGKTQVSLSTNPTSALF
tara:strand:- start:1336 stop:1611 length:276 start_codon:yes stop_codon:yes gene_type:complete